MIHSKSPAEEHRRRGGRSESVSRKANRGTSHDRVEKVSMEKTGNGLVKMEA